MNLGTILTRIGLICVFCIYIVRARAQVDTIWSDLDPNNVESYESIVNNIFSALDQSAIPTGILHDRTMMQSRIDSLKGLTTDVKNAGLGDWLQIYYEMHLGAFNMNGIPNYEKLMKDAGDHRTATNEIPVGVIDISYNRIKPDAFTSNLLLISNGKLHDVAGRSTSPYTTHRVFTAMPLMDTLRELTNKFVIKPEFIRENQAADVTKYELDFGDGQGFRTVYLNTPVTVTYNNYSARTIRLRTTYENSSNRTSKAKLSCVPYLLADPDRSSTDNSAPADVHVPIVGLRKYEGPGYIPNPLYPTLKGSCDVWYGSETTSSGCTKHEYIKKPVVFLMGFDPGNTVDSPEKKYAAINRHKFLDVLRSEGCDVIIVDNAYGSDYVQNNGYLLEMVLRNINGNNNDYPGLKCITNHETVVVGYSAGAMGARYVLAQMEKEFTDGSGIDPRVSKLILVEGEHQGCNIPLGMQHFLATGLSTLLSANPAAVVAGHKIIGSLSSEIINTFAPFIALGMPTPSSLVSFPLNAEVLQSPTAKQMLSYHWSTFGRNPLPEFNILRDELKNNFNHPGTTNAGYPSRMRLIGVANGSSVNATADWPYSTKMFELAAGTRTTLFDLTTNVEYFSTSSAPDAPVMYVGTRLIAFPGLPVEETHTTDYIDVKISGPLPYDQAPSSTLNYHNAILHTLQDATTFIGGVRVDGVSGHESFVPPTSALDIRNASTGQPVDLIFDIKNLGLTHTSPGGQPGDYGYPHIAHGNNAKLITPFDAVYVNPAITEHCGTGMQRTIQEFLIEEIQPQFMFLQDRSVSNYAATFEARGTINIGNHVTHSISQGDFNVGLGGDVEIISGYEITLEDGFNAFAGSEFKASINPYMCPKDSTVNDDISNNQRVADADFAEEPSERLTNPDLVENSTALKSMSIVVAPNPGQGVYSVTLASDEPARISVYSLSGAVVADYAVNAGRASIDLREQPKGMYLFVIQNNDGSRETKRIIYE